MSTSNFITGQSVVVTSDYNHFQANNDTVYQIGGINRIQGLNSVQLLLNSRCVGAIPENKLKPAK